jgi:hypothetical protein
MWIGAMKSTYTLHVGINEILPIYYTFIMQFGQKSVQGMLGFFYGYVMTPWLFW